MFIVKIAEHNTRFGGIKQEIQEFKAEFDFLLVDLNNEIQTKFADINKKLNEIENSIKSNITKQVDKNIISVNIIIVLNLEHKLWQSEAHINNLDQCNSRNNASEDKVINTFHSLNINVNRNGIEDCYRQGKADPNHTIVRFVNRKFCYETLDKKFNLRKVDSTKLGKK